MTSLLTRAVPPHFPTAMPPAPASPPWAALLAHFYAKAGLPLPKLERLKPVEVPQPYKFLLVHSSDMTPTLEGFYQAPLGIAVLSREQRDDDYLREVILTLDDGARPVAYGVIRIHLDHFPAAARRRILSEHLPLGAILQSEAIGHIGWPQAFFRAESDSHIGAVLRLRRPAALFGRRNVLLDGARRLLADVIEVLAPAEPRASS